QVGGDRAEVRARSVRIALQGTIDLLNQRTEIA
ncbi:MAG TPA: damage-inducible protein CinA, partial [Gallionella sp.]|nr:damage-inducible protein CinA [Gallionella sp.]